MGFLILLNYCTFTGVKWVIGVDKYRKIKFCCLQSKAAEPYLALCGLDREDVLRRFVFVEGPGLYHQASTGIFSNRMVVCLPFMALLFFFLGMIFCFCEEMVSSWYHVRTSLHLFLCHIQIGNRKIKLIPII